MRVAKPLSVFFVLLMAGVGAYLNRGSWSKLLKPTSVTQASAAQATPPIQEARTLKMTEQARKNLGLVSKQVKPQGYWRTIEVPGEIVDRPG